MQKPNDYKGLDSSEAVINNAVEVLTNIFTGWRATFKNKINDRDFIAYKKEFLTAMILAGINSQAQIDRGMMRARYEAEQGKEFLPSGAKFAGWCKPSPKEFGIADFETVFDAVIFGKWEQIHPVFQHVAQKRRFKFRKRSEAEAKRMFKPVYEDAVAKVLAGNTFEPIPALPDYTQKTNFKMKPYASGQNAISALLGEMRGRASA